MNRFLNRRPLIYVEEATVGGGARVLQKKPSVLGERRAIRRGCTDWSLRGAVQGHGCRLGVRSRRGNVRGYCRSRLLPLLRFCESPTEPA